MASLAKQAIAVADPASPEAVLQQLSAVTRQLLESLWPGRIPLGKLTLLAGDPGLGKSFVTLDMAARVSKSDAWPDAPLAAGKVHPPAATRLGGGVWNSTRRP